MSWTFDSTKITYDQTCWTWDGDNNCSLVSGAGSGVRQAGPGFFLFFKDESVNEVLSSNPAIDYSYLDRLQKIKKDDDEILMIVCSAITRMMS